MISYMVPHVHGHLLGDPWFDPCLGSRQHPVDAVQYFLTVFKTWTNILFTG